jgi:hypothetical protein
LFLNANFLKLFADSIYILGGNDGTGILNVVELYSPSNGGQIVGPMPKADSVFCATVIGK